MTTALPWTSAGVAAGYRRNPRVSTASATDHGTPRQMPRFSHGTRRSSVGGKLGRINHGNPAAVAISTDFRGRCHGNAAITPEVREIVGQFPRHFPRTSSQRNFHDHPRPSAAIAKAIPRYAAIITQVCGCRWQRPQHVPQFCPRQLRRTNHAHGSCIG